MKKEYKVNGKVTYPQGMVSRTTYTLIDDVGNMINLNADIDTDFDYGDAVIMILTKKNGVKATSEKPTTVDPISGSVTTDNTATTDTTADTASMDTAKPDATTTADTTDTGTQTAAAAATETEAK